MTDIVTLGIAVDTTDVVGASKGLDKLVGSAKKAENAVDRFGNELKKTDIAAGRFIDKTGKMREANGRFVKGLDKTNKSLKENTKSTDRLKRATAALLSVATAVKVVGYADAWTNAQNSIRQVTDSTAQLNDVTRKLRDAAQDSRSGFAATSDLYAKLKRSSDNLGLSQRELIDITTTINKSFSAAGATATEAENAIRQLAQGLSSGALRGDEFNSVAEQAPGILRAISASTGIAAGEMRAFAATGGITSEIIVKALQEQAKAIDDDFGRSIETFGQQLKEANDNVTEFVGSSADIKTAVSGVGDSIVFLSENLGEIGKVATGIAAATAAIMLMNNAIKIATVSMAAFNVVSNINPMVLLAKAVIATTAAVGAYVLLTDDATVSVKESAAANKQLEETLVNIGRVYASNGKIVGDLTEESARARVAELEAGIERNKAVLINSQLERTALGLEIELLEDKIKLQKESSSIFAQAADPLAVGKLKNLRSEIEARDGLVAMLGVEWQMANALIDSNNKEIKTINDAIKARKKAASETGKLSKATGQLSAAQKKLIELMREGESVFRSTRTPLESHGIELAKINVLLDAGAISQDTYSRAVNALTEDFKSSTGVTAENEAALKSIEDQQQKTFDAWSDNISGVLSQTLDLDDVLKNLANTLLRDAFVNPLLISVGLGGAGNSAGGSAGGGSNDIFGAISSGYNAFDGATSGAFNSFATSGVGKSLGLSSTSSAFTGAKSGIGTTTSLTGAGDFLGGGFSGASSLGGLAAGLLGLGSGDTLVDTTTSVLGGAIGNFLLPGIGGAIGSFLGTSLGGMFGGSGKPTSFSFSSQDEQERFEGQNAFTMDSAFGETLFKVFNGRDEDTNIVAAMTPIINTIAALESSIASTFSAAQIGRVTAGVASADFRSEDADAAVNNFVESRLGAILTELGPQFTELASTSELVGVASLQYTAMLVAVNEQLEQGGPLIGLFNDDLNSTVAFLNQIKNDDQTLAQAFEGLAQVQAVYYENFFTEQERFDKVLDSATASLDEFNSSIGLAGDAAIDTRAEFRDYVEALDLTSEAGRQALESALGLQGALLFVANAADAAAGATVRQVESLVDQDLVAANLAAAQLQINTRNSVSKVLSDNAKKDKDLANAADLDARNANTQALDSLNIVRSSFGVVKDAVALQKDVINEKISNLSDIVDSAFSARNSLRSSNLIASSIDRESAQDIIKRAAGGEQISAREITSSLDIISEPAENLFKTFVDYQRDFSKTSISISDLENNTKDALTSEERSLQALTDIENNAQSQLNALLGIDSRVLSLSESLNTFSSSLASSKASAVAATTAASTAKVANDTADASAALLSSDTQTNDRTDFRSFVDSITSDYKTGAGAGTGRLTTDEGFQIYNYAAANNISLNQVDEFLGFTGDQALRFVQDNNLPAFANGGNHSGGLRMVGEVGPELELTGPSRIISNSDLMSGLSKNDENSGGDDQMNRLLSKIQLFLDRIYRQQQQWTADALNVRVVT